MSSRPGFVEVGGIPVELRIKRQKTVRLHVDPDGLVWISAPPDYPLDRVREFALSRRRWIEERLAALEERRGARTLWGEPLPDAVQGPPLFRLYRAEVRLATAELAARWEPLVGRRAAGWRFRWMKSRWGSCNPQTGQ
ncbi:MAG: M48 family metallopeptidase, partial [Bifidobacteriaceae bacterium]|nr:M48 family metallopeptidase [Bifidobacteriaceae bacterium]